MPSNAHTLKWGNNARNDFRKIIEFIDEVNPPAAEALAEQILESVDRLLTFPLSYRSGREPGTREMPVGKYVVIYTVSETDVFIFRLLHSAQQWP
ncbi:type II toxin-antitoxin system RelE/ParE family toxin [Rhizobium leguminosarum bv. viciae]|uniref:type II toxin-antitoxin system RelE/ParE family toxin n=1 Tax=Rhizobium TaxID=379 RepID=UPI0010396409|nr:type II toxin-antitoxin system RelE/ParE family toxin [Rhizobium leguminosarum]TBY66370.1 type II toxin-antitoxin system RelE/ParE family toxin [Rhizobium leguminosarum bv. viciae]